MAEPTYELKNPPTIQDNLGDEPMSDAEAARMLDRRVREASLPIRLAYFTDRRGRAFAKVQSISKRRCQGSKRQPEFEVEINLLLTGKAKLWTSPSVQKMCGCAACGRAWGNGLVKKLKQALAVTWTSEEMLIEAAVEDGSLSVELTPTEEAHYRFVPVNQLQARCYDIGQNPIKNRRG